MKRDSPKIDHTHCEIQMNLNSFAFLNIMLNLFPFQHPTSVLDFQQSIKIETKNLACVSFLLQSTRSRPVKLFQSASTEESIEATSSDIRTIPTTSKQPKQRWSVLFGLKNPQQNQLCEILNNYTKNGVPQLKSSSFSFDHADLPPALEYLENIHSSWKEFVCYSNMADNEIKIQSAIWELVTTEVDYIHALQTVTDVSNIYYILRFEHFTVYLILNTWRSVMQIISA